MNTLTKYMIVGILVGIALGISGKAFANHVEEDKVRKVTRTLVYQMQLAIEDEEYAVILNNNFLTCVSVWMLINLDKTYAIHDEDTEMIGAKVLVHASSFWVALGAKTGISAHEFAGAPVGMRVEELKPQLKTKETGEQWVNFCYDFQGVMVEPAEQYTEELLQEALREHDLEQSI